MKAAKRGSARRVWAAAVHTEDERQRQPANPPFSNPPACRNKSHKAPKRALGSQSPPLAPAPPQKHIRSPPAASMLAHSLARWPRRRRRAQRCLSPPTPVARRHFLPGCPRPYLTPIAASTISGIMRPPLVQTEPAAKPPFGPSLRRQIQFLQPLHETLRRASFLIFTLPYYLRPPSLFVT